MVELRTASSSDADFLFQVFRETNIEMFASLAPEMCEQLLKQQSALQESQYASHYPQLRRSIILKSGTSVGRLYLSRFDGELVLVNIAILPSRQKEGIGTDVLQGLITDARERGIPIRLHVVQHSRAAMWYRQHGFSDVSVSEPYIEMVLRPS
ncbi:GNAT family N-acetyltransferase [Pontiellaceae bacterium B1224]|nr:GNAT family N-acetyltransferase [Pontiellaceae bacterium B1224]